MRVKQLGGLGMGGIALALTLPACGVGDLIGRILPPTTELSDRPTGDGHDGEPTDLPGELVASGPEADHALLARLWRIVDNDDGGVTHWVGREVRPPIWRALEIELTAAQDKLVDDGFDIGDDLDVGILKSDGEIAGYCIYFSVRQTEARAKFSYYLFISPSFDTLGHELMPEIPGIVEFGPQNEALRSFLAQNLADQGATLEAIAHAETAGQAVPRSLAEVPGWRAQHMNAYLQEAIATISDIAGPNAVTTSTQVARLDIESGRDAFDAPSYSTAGYMLELEIQVDGSPFDRKVAYFNRNGLLCLER